MQNTGVSILTGAVMQWFRDPTGNYYVAYKLPHSNMYALFDATPEQMDSIYGVGQRPGTTVVTSINALTGQNQYQYSGNIGEVSGTGSFEAAVDRGIALALGGNIPEWQANSPEIWDILYIAQAEDKSNDWVLAQIRKTTAFEKRFPGIENFEALGMTLGESVNAFIEYEAGLSQIAKRYPNMGISTVTPQIVGDLVGRGQSLDDVTFVFGIFERMKQNTASFEAFNQILVNNYGVQPLTQTDQFAFLAGYAPADLYNIWEQNSLLTAARQAGIKGFGLNESLALANATPGLTSEGQAFEGMSTAAKLILQYRREISLGRLDQDDLIDLSLGSAPRSGRSQAELAQEMTRIVREAEAFIGNKIRPFIGFTSTGKPQAQSFGEFTKITSAD